MSDRMHFHASCLYLLLFFSGAAGLSYEIVWTRMLATVLGHEIVAVLAVVAAFFSGLAIGSWVLDRPVSVSNHPGRWYAGLEAAVGLWSLALGAVFPWVASAAAGLMGADPGPLRHWSVAFLLPFLVLLPATSAMGGTLPAMERLFSRLRRDGRAVAGTLAATFWITPAWGFKSNQLILAVVNFLCAAGALLAAAGDQKSVESMGAETERRPDVGRVYVSLFATGLLGIGYEILVVRAFSQILENTVYSFAAILSVYLFGTALGRAVYQVRPPKPGFRTALGRLAKGLCLACMTGLFLLFFVEKIYSAVRGWIGPGAAGALTAELSAAAAVFLPPTVVMGMTFSHLAQSACRKKGGLGRALSVNTVGAAVSVVADPGGHVHLKVNNHYQMGGTSSAYSDRRQAHIPLLLHPAPQRALFLGLGTGPHALRRSRGA